MKKGYKIPKAKKHIHNRAQKARDFAYKRGLRGVKETLYFAYGSNLHLEQMRLRCPTAEPVAAATLRGWKLVFRGVADIAEGKADDLVYGAVFRIREKDEHALDVYEGYPHLYIKRFVTVKLADGSNARAMVYVMKSRKTHSTPSDFYFNVIKEGFENWALPLVELFDAERISTAISNAARAVVHNNSPRTLFAVPDYDLEPINEYEDPTMDDFIEYVADAQDRALIEWARSFNR